VYLAKIRNLTLIECLFNAKLFFFSSSILFFENQTFKESAQPLSIYHSINYRNATAKIEKLSTLTIKVGKSGKF
jgi:hypothetical protein